MRHVVLYALLGLVIGVVAIAVLSVGLSVIMAFRSPNPRAHFKLTVSVQRAVAMLALIGLTRRLASVFGAYRLDQPYKGAHATVFRPTSIGKALALYTARLVEQLAEEPGYDLVLLVVPNAPPKSDLRRRAANARRCMDGVRWYDSDVHGLAPKGLVMGSLAVLGVPEEGDVDAPPPVLHVFSHDDAALLAQMATVHYEARIDAVLREKQALALATAPANPEDMEHLLDRQRWIDEQKRNIEQWERIAAAVAKVCAVPTWAKVSSPPPADPAKRFAERVFANAMAEDTAVDERFAEHVFANTVPKAAAGAVDHLDEDVDLSPAASALLQELIIKSKGASSFTLTPVAFSALVAEAVLKRLLAVEDGRIAQNDLELCTELLDALTQLGKGGADASEAGAPSEDGLTN